MPLYILLGGEFCPLGFPYRAELSPWRVPITSAQGTGYRFPYIRRRVPVGVTLRYSLRLTSAKFS